MYTKGPLDRMEFSSSIRSTETDIVLIYGNPAQLILLINALQFEDYEVWTFIVWANLHDRMPLDGVI